MKIGIIGRTEILYETTIKLLEAGHEVMLIITAKEAPEYKKKAEDFKLLAQQINCKYIYTNKINQSFIISMIKDMKLDIGISMNYVNIISEEVINAFKLGILNAHAGDLPRYRGNAVIAWAILNGESKIGLCIHKMIGDELDSGDIIARKYFDININTKITSVWEWMYNNIPNLFLDSIKKLEIDPEYILEKQSKEYKDILRCYPLTPEDGRINWFDSRLNVIRKVNAFNKPYNGAFSYFNNEKITIWDAEIYDDEEIYCAVPGQVAKINSDGSIIVICGDGKIKINICELNNELGAPNRWIKSIRKRLG